MSILRTQLGLEDEATRLTPRAWAALMLISLALMLSGFFNLPTMDRDEARYSQASRQMIETGDYVDIRFQEQARHVKPVGIYWMQVATVAPFGGADAPQWAHRLPSLIGCLAAVGMTAWFGARLGGARVGFAAGVLMAAGLLLAIEARTAKTDAMLLASITLAQLALYYIFHPPDAEQKQKFVGWPLVFWAAQGLGLIIKGPIITLVSGVTIIALSLWRRDVSIIRKLRILPGLGVMILVVLPWLAAITIKTNGGFLEEALGHALFGKVAQGDDSHGAPPGYHTIALLLTWWPAAMLLPLGAAYAWTKRREPMVQYLICWIVPTWLVFEAVVTKLPHYTFPVFPAMAILMALGVKDAASLLAGRGTRITHWLMTVLFVVLTGLLAYVPYWLATEIGAPEAPGAATFGVVAGLIVVVAGLYLALKPQLDRLLPLAGAAVVFYVAIFAMTLPAMDRFWLSHSLKEFVSTGQGCEAVPFATFGYREPSVVFHFGTQTLLAADESAIEHLASNPQCGLIAVSQVEQEAFTAMAAARNLTLQTHGVIEGYNYVKGDELVMTVYSLEGATIQFPSTQSTD